jgi:feruloyl-CoA synthase
MGTAGPSAMPSTFFDDPQMLAPPAVIRHELGGGAFVLRSPVALAPYARCVGEWLERWWPSRPPRAAGRA